MKLSDLIHVLKLLQEEYEGDLDVLDDECGVITGAEYYDDSFERGIIFTRCVNES